MSKSIVIDWNTFYCYLCSKKFNGKIYLYKWLLPIIKDRKIQGFHEDTGNWWSPSYCRDCYLQLKRKNVELF